MIRCDGSIYIKIGWIIGYKTQQNLMLIYKKTDALLGHLFFYRMTDLISYAISTCVASEFLDLEVCNCLL